MDVASKESKYSLLGSDEDREDDCSNVGRKYDRGKGVVSRSSLLISWLITFVSLVFVVFPRQDRHLASDWRESDFASINHRLYRPITEPAYIGQPTLEMDAEWKKLTEATNIFVTPDEQEQLGGDLFLYEPAGLYTAQLTVFHDLYCLNFIRQSLYPDYYPEMRNDYTWQAHLEHCIDAIRLSVMCSGDMTIIPVKWSENTGWIMPIFDTTHTCRDFDALRAWALERQLTNDDTFQENVARLRAKAGMSILQT
ncbi:hypothetical protein F5Y16DRAFT_406399 [Xylariaceae sp. FL0255]|nr:hypothetical protein F5Y16DRAFT_406399 [Xylariaceae sp. FL0255]